MFRPAKLALLIGVGFSLVTPACSQAPADPADPTPSAAISDFAEEIEKVRTEHDLIALGAVVASSDGIIDLAVSGTRAKGRNDPVQVTDTWHLGSNTKALTALLYGQLVQRGLAKWGATLPELFPDLSETIDPAWQDVTIEDLFAHRTGMRQMGGLWLNARRRDDRPVSEQRRRLAEETLQAPPSGDPTSFDYNNLNYMIAGAAIETILSKSADLPDTWETAMQALLFDQLSAPNSSGFGFGPPQEGLEGHRSFLGAFLRAVGRGASADNPQILGPAGTLNARLDAHAMLVSEFLKTESALVPAELREHLFAPHPDGESGYALGWGVYDHQTHGRLYQHSGSNTMWYSLTVIAPDLDRVVIVNTNQFSDAAQTAANDIARTALERANISD